MYTPHSPLAKLMPDESVAAATEACVDTDLAEYYAACSEDSDTQSSPRADRHGGGNSAGNNDRDCSPTHARKDGDDGDYDSTAGASVWRTAARNSPLRGRAARLSLSQRQIMRQLRLCHAAKSIDEPSAPSASSVHPGNHSANIVSKQSVWTKKMVSQLADPLGLRAHTSVRSHSPDRRGVGAVHRDAVIVLDVLSALAQNESMSCMYRSSDMSNPSSSSSNRAQQASASPVPALCERSGWVLRPHVERALLLQTVPRCQSWAFDPPTPCTAHSTKQNRVRLDQKSKNMDKSSSRSESHSNTSSRLCGMGLLAVCRQLLAQADVVAELAHELRYWDALEPSQDNDDVSSHTSMYMHALTLEPKLSASYALAGAALGALHRFAQHIRHVLLEMKIWVTVTQDAILSREAQPQQQSSQSSDVLWFRITRAVDSRVTVVKQLLAIAQQSRCFAGLTELPRVAAHDDAAMRSSVTDTGVAEWEQRCASQGAALLDFLVIRASAMQDGARMTLYSLYMTLLVWCMWPYVQFCIAAVAGRVVMLHRIRWRSLLPRLLRVPLVLFRGAQGSGGGSPGILTLVESCTDYHAALHDADDGTHMPDDGACTAGVEEDGRAPRGYAGTSRHRDYTNYYPQDRYYGLGGKKYSSNRYTRNSCGGSSRCDVYRDTCVAATEPRGVAGVAMGTQSQERTWQHIVLDHLIALATPARCDPSTPRSHCPNDEHDAPFPPGREQHDDSDTLHQCMWQRPLQLCGAVDNTRAITHRTMSTTEPNSLCGSSLCDWGAMLGWWTLCAVRSMTESDIGLARPGDVPGESILHGMEHATDLSTSSLQWLSSSSRADGLSRLPHVRALFLDTRTPAVRWITVALLLPLARLIRRLQQEQLQLLLMPRPMSSAAPHSHRSSMRKLDGARADIGRKEGEELDEEAAVYAQDVLGQQCDFARHHNRLHARGMHVGCAYHSQRFDDALFGSRALGGGDFHEALTLLFDVALLRDKERLVYGFLQTLLEEPYWWYRVQASVATTSSGTERGIVSLSGHKKKKRNTIKKRSRPRQNITASMLRRSDSPAPTASEKISDAFARAIRSHASVQAGHDVYLCVLPPSSLHSDSKDEVQDTDQMAQGGAEAAAAAAEAEAETTEKVRTGRVLAQEILEVFAAMRLRFCFTPAISAVLLPRLLYPSSACTFSSSSSAMSLLGVHSHPRSGEMHSDHRTSVAKEKSLGERYDEAFWRYRIRGNSTDRDDNSNGNANDDSGSRDADLLGDVWSYLFGYLCTLHFAQLTLRERRKALRQQDSVDHALLAVIGHAGGAQHTGALYRSARGAGRAYHTLGFAVDGLLAFTQRECVMAIMAIEELVQDTTSSPSDHTHRNTSSWDVPSYRDVCYNLESSTNDVPGPRVRVRSCVELARALDVCLARLRSICLALPHTRNRSSQAEGQAGSTVVTARSDDIGNHSSVVKANTLDDLNSGEGALSCVVDTVVCEAVNEVLALALNTDRLPVRLVGMRVRAAVERLVKVLQLTTHRHPQLQPLLLLLTFNQFFGKSAVSYQFR